MERRRLFRDTRDTRDTRDNLSLSPLTRESLFSSSPTLSPLSPPAFEAPQKKRREHENLEAMLEAAEIELEPVVVLFVGTSPTEEVWITKEATKFYQFSDKLGSGTTGTVYKAYLPTDRHHERPAVAIKVQMISSGSFEEEVDMARKMSDLGIGPNFIDAWEVADEGVGFLVTDKWDISLWDFTKRQLVIKKHLDPLPFHLLHKLSALIKRLHQQRIVHGDILEKNILLRLKSPDSFESDDILDVTLTDFGLMQPISRWKSTPDFLETMFNYHIDPVNNTRYYFRDRHVNLDDLIDDPRHLDWALLYYMNNYMGKKSSQVKQAKQSGQAKQAKRRRQ